MDEQNNTETYEMTNDKMRTSLTEDIQNHCKTQPIIYLEKAPDIQKMVEDMHLLYTEPVVKAGSINRQLMDAVSHNNTPFYDLFNNDYMLRQYPKNTAVDVFTNYVTQNTLVSFCAMLDYTGRLLNSVINYIPIKKYVEEELLKADEIRHIIADFVYNTGKTSFSVAFNPHNDIDDDSMSDLFNKLEAQNCVYSAQLSMHIFTPLCMGVNRALTEALMGTRVCPNVEYIVEAGCKYFGITDKNYIRNKQEVYFRLNNLFTDMLNRFMGSVVKPMCDRLFSTDLFANYYFGPAGVPNDSSCYDKGRIRGTNYREDFDF